MFLRVHRPQDCRMRLAAVGKGVLWCRELDVALVAHTDAAKHETSAEKVVVEPL